MHVSSFDLHRHVSEEHRISPLSTYLREIVYGGTDGIVTTFAVVAGFTGAQAQYVGSLPFFVVLLFGFANLFADGISMALGNFLSTRSDQDVYRYERSKEFHQIQVNPEFELRETIAILQQKGFSHDQAHTLVSLYRSNEKYWLDFMMSRELGMRNPENDNAFAMAGVTFLSFLSFGMIPLLPYLFFSSFSEVFFLSLFFAGTALFLLGILRWRVARQQWVRCVGETLLLGGVAAGVAYGVGMFFRL